MKQILKSFLIIAAAVAIVGGTYAYFSVKGEVLGSDITTGTLTIDIQDQNTDTTMTPFHITGLLPGDTALVNFDVKNTSTSGVQIRGAAVGNWVDTSLTDTMISVAKVERWDGFVWVTLASVDPITGIFYDSPTGADTANYTIPAGGKSQFRVTVKLSVNAGDSYQNEVYNASLYVQARQAGATIWPADLNSGF